jgi:apolipoprotein N-acyltransferase
MTSEEPMSVAAPVQQIGPPAAPAPPPGPRRFGRPQLARLAGAVFAGVALYLAFPPYGRWPLAPLAVAVFAGTVQGRRLRAGFGLGLVTGLVFFVPLLSWTGLNVGAFPWLLLSSVQAVFFGLLGLAAAGCSTLVHRYPRLWPVITALLWTAQEAARDRLPFGGFPWGRLAFSQADSPALRFAAIGGAPLVTFVVALCGGLLAAAGWWLWRSLRAAPADAERPARLRLAGGLAALLAVAVPAAGWLAPLHTAAGPAVTVAIVQGNVPRLGLDFNAQRRAVLDNHVRATLDLAERVTAGQARRPDLVVWPENASDIDPLATDDPDARVLINQAADAIGAPILVGAVLEGPGADHARNAGILWLPGSGPDVDQLYVKRHPVPFAEYMPLRSVAHAITSKADLVRVDFVAGTHPGVMHTSAGTLGDVICFEVAYDGIVRDTVTGGAQLLTVQTNNATFNTAEAEQQLAMVRLRAVEHGRSSLMASTVGVSAFVDTHGRVSQATGFNTASVVVAELPRSDARTLATDIGAAPEYCLVGLTVLMLIWAGVLGWRRRTTARQVGAGTVQEDM